MYKPNYNRFKKPRTRINEYIRIPKVMVIDDEGNQLGILDTNEARRIAQEKELDLVEIAPNVRPPVCKIMDYGKYKYQQEKKEQKSKKKQKKVEIKGVRISLRISKNDLEFKARQADKFFKQGNKVRVELIMRGRENAHRDLANQKLKEFVATIGYPIIIEQHPKKERLGLAMVIAKDTKKDTQDHKSNEKPPIL